MIMDILMESDDALYDNYYNISNKCVDYFNTYIESIQHEGTYLENDTESESVFQKIKKVILAILESAKKVITSIGNKIRSVFTDSKLKEAEKIARKKGAGVKVEMLDNKKFDMATSKLENSLSHEMSKMNSGVAPDVQKIKNEHAEWKKVAAVSAVVAVPVSVAIGMLIKRKKSMNEDESSIKSPEEEAKANAEKALNYLNNGIDPSLAVDLNKIKSDIAVEKAKRNAKTFNIFTKIKDLLFNKKQTDIDTSNIKGIEPFPPDKETHESCDVSLDDVDNLIESAEYYRKKRNAEAMLESIEEDLDFGIEVDRYSKYLSDIENTLGI